MVEVDDRLLSVASTTDFCRPHVEEPSLSTNTPIEQQPEEQEASPRATAQPVEDAELISWVRTAAEAAEDKLGQRTDAFYVGGILGITDWFVVTSGRNNRQVGAIVEAVEEALSRADGPKPIRIEGRETMSWVLMDYGFFVIHVFTDEARDHYDLERLWKDVPRLDLIA